MMTSRPNSFLAATTLLSVLSGAAILNFASPANAATITQTNSSSLNSGSDLFQQFDSSLGTLKSVLFDYDVTANADIQCSTDGRFCNSVYSLLGIFDVGALFSDNETAGTLQSDGDIDSFSAKIIGSRSFIAEPELASFIGNGRVGSYALATDLFSFGGSLSIVPNTQFLSSNLKLTYEYEAAPTTPIPTPALLPGLIGMGVAALRKKGQEEPAEQEA